MLRRSSATSPRHTSLLAATLLAHGCLVDNPNFSDDEATTASGTSSSASTTATGTTTASGATAGESSGAGTSTDSTDSTDSTAPTDPTEASSTGSIEPICGDRVIDEGELCDDGNTDNSDGCTQDCLFTPTQLLIGPPEVQPLQGSDGGYGGPSKTTDDCPGSLVRGVRVVPDYTPEQRWVAGIQIYCGAPQLVGLTVTVTDAGALPYRKADYADEGAAMDLICPKDQVVVTAAGSAGSVLDNLGITCAPLLLAPTPQGYQIVPGPLTPFGPHGSANGQTFADPCAGAMSGAYIHLGSWVNGYATRCSTLTLQ